MKGTDGKTYDIDFFLTGQPGKMKVTDTSVHKIDGKPLYNWKEENGKWNKVPVKQVRMIRHSFHGRELMQRDLYQATSCA